MEARPGDAQAGTRDELAHQIAHLQAKNAELEQRYNNLESKLVDVLAATKDHEEMIQALRAQNESLKAAVGVTSHRWLCSPSPPAASLTIRSVQMLGHVQMVENGMSLVMMMMGVHTLKDPLGTPVLMAANAFPNMTTTVRLSGNIAN